MLVSRVARHQRKALNARFSDAHGEPWYDGVEERRALARPGRLERPNEPIGESPPCHIPLRDNNGTTDVALFECCPMRRNDTRNGGESKGTWGYTTGGQPA